MDKNIKPLTLLEMSEAAQKRVNLIYREFSEGFEFIKNYPRSVTFFGSARTKESEHYYEKARNLAKKIVEKTHYSVLTGGGPGIMEAANRGAFEAGGNSLGLTIDLPKENDHQQYFTNKINFHYFFSRKVCLSFSAETYIFFPGGFGTLDEFTEILTLTHTNRIPRVPIILVGEEHWKHLDQFFQNTLIKNGMIDEKDTSIYTITDNEEEILEIIKNAPIRMGVAYDEKSEEPVKHNDEETELGSLSELSKKHCVPCEGGASPLSREESENYLRNMSEWSLEDDREIQKTFEFKDFSEAMNFMNAVAYLAEEEGHHPDIKLHDYKKVDIKISTHAIGGLSENDFILAAKIDETLREKKF